MMHSRCLSVLLCLALSAIACNAQEANAFADPFCQMSYWAPGVINQQSGAVEMDIRFFTDRVGLNVDYQNFFTVSGNGGVGGSINILSINLCPPVDGRDFSTLFRGPKLAAYILCAAPTWDPTGAKSSRLTITWGGGKCQAWFDGKKLGEQSMKSPIAQLPETFKAGYSLDSGRTDAFRIQALRISDTSLSDTVLAAPAPLAADEHTTFFATDSKASAPVTTWQQQQFQSAIFPERYNSKFVTPEGTPFVVPLRMVNYTDKASDFKLRAVIRDRSGKEVTSQEYPLSVPAGSRYTTGSITFPKIDASGYYESTVTMTGPAGVTGAYDIAFVVQAKDALKPGKLAEFLGHHDRFGVTPTIYSQVDIRWHRMWARDRGMLWCSVEPMPGHFDWQAADASVAAAQKEGIKVLGVLGYPPTWASTYSPEAKEQLSKATSKKSRYSNNPERFQPRDIEQWKKYVRAVVTRYHDRVKHWEIYNEVDFHPPAMHATFSGSTQDYFDLLKSAYEVIKEVDPSCQVLTSGFSLTKGVTDYKMPIDLLALGAAQYFDIFNVHGYSDLETLGETTKAVRAAKPDAPLWMSEFMYEAPSDDYAVVLKAFWFLDHGYEKYFLHGGEQDRLFGELKITPFYAVSAELARQLRTCESYLGPASGVDGKFRSWRFKRSDGTFLNVFAVDNGTVDVTFSGSKKETEMRVTGLYGDTLFKGNFDLSKSLEFTSLVYIDSADDIKVVKAVRRHGNVLTNPGFEMREGDYMSDESAARPVGWDLRPSGTPQKAMSFVPGRAGTYALKLATLGSAKTVYTGQVVILDVPGTWNLSAAVKSTAGSNAVLIFKLNQSGIWREVIRRVIPGTGDWQTITAPAEVKGENSRGVVLLGLESENSSVEYDEACLIYASPQEGTP